MILKEEILIPYGTKTDLAGILVNCRAEKLFNSFFKKMEFEKDYAIKLHRSAQKTTEGILYQLNLTAKEIPVIEMCKIDLTPETRFLQSETSFRTKLKNCFKYLRETR